MTSGIHHITLITRKVQPNVDFYVGFLGLRLVKRTAGFEDAAQLHLFYGDAAGSPGSLVSFLVWQDGAPGRVGHGQPSEIAFAVAPDSIGFWLTRALKEGLTISGPAQEFGEPVLRLKDPDGVIVKLVGAPGLPSKAPYTVSGIPPEDAIRCLRGATVLTEKPQETSDFIQRHAGFTQTAETASIRRLTSVAGDCIDVRDAAGFWTAAPGTGTIDHIAFRLPDTDAIAQLHDRLANENAGETAVHDRTYFASLYVREPGGSLFEFATDAPGMLVDEPAETLGQALFVPAHFGGAQRDNIVLLPQFSLPGEPRMTERDLPFVHRLHEPAQPDGTTLFLLHGSGDNELGLLPLGRRIMPNALLVSLRGRSLEEGVPRFFRRFTPFTFDQADIQAEAEALAAFIEGAVSGYGIDLQKAVFLGYSNGANMIAATLFLHPGLIRNAILLRAMNPLEEVPPADLKDVRVLSLSGRHDAYRRLAVALENALGDSGAAVTTIELDTGHEIGDADNDSISRFLGKIRLLDTAVAPLR